MADLTAIILTLNEEKNIRECIASIQSIAKRIVVVDSFSTDKTVEIAKEMGAEVIAHEFVNQAQQFIYAIDTLDIDTKWILRIDADERFTEKSAAELEALTVEHAEDDVNGIVVRFEVSFMGKIIRRVTAGTLESSDVFVTLEPCSSGLEIEIDSVVQKQFGEAIRQVAEETLNELDIQQGRLSIVDRGALDCVIRARVETAVLRGKGE